MRAEYLARHPDCERCGAPGEVVHHRIPLPHGTHNWENLVTLCRHCHAEAHRSGIGGWKNLASARPS
ncbi:MAG: HNH endonuclease, partial [Firmicutes bacterium]|nr:HNH endonuclease [Bacillota bacterium]